MKNLLLSLFIIFTLSCSLDRTNPLDPFVSGDNAPNEVTNVQVSITDNNTIMITWNSVNNVDGYYIYRSQSYNGLYILIKDEESFAASSYEDNDVDIPGNFYWYKMSAYIELDEGKLEGYRSEPKTWN
jgi:fibronectin type 3 domain-containing protein